MESQVFNPDAYSLRPVDLIPDDFDDDEPELDARWVHYCEVSASLDTEDLMTTVGEAFSNSDLLRDLIEEAKAHPFHPNERKRLHIDDCRRLGDLIATLIAQAQDDAVDLRMAIGGAR